MANTLLTGGSEDEARVNGYQPAWGDITPIRGPGSPSFGDQIPQGYRHAGKIEFKLELSSVALLHSYITFHRIATSYKI